MTGGVAQDGEDDTLSVLGGAFGGRGGGQKVTLKENETVLVLS